jgi:hypothetical protein
MRFMRALAVFVLVVSVACEPTDVPRQQDETVTPDNAALDDHGDTPETATVLTIPARNVKGRFEREGDEDVFRFELARPGVWESSCVSRMKMTLRDAAGVPLFSGGLCQETGYEPGRYFLDLPAGRYTLHAKAGWDLEYTFSLTPPPADDHGDTAATATPLTLNTPVGGFLAGWSDPDAFRFEARAGVGYEVDVSSFMFNLLRIHVQDASGRTVECSGGPRWWCQLTAPASGSYVVVLQSDILRDFRLSLRELGVDDHGDTSATATPLALGAPARGTLHLMNDRDVFQLELGAGGYVARSEGDTAEFLLKVTDASGRELPRGGWGVVTAEASGTYFLNVTRLGVERAPKTYTVYLEPEVLP